MVDGSNLSEAQEGEPEMEDEEPEERDLRPWRAAWFGDLALATLLSTGYVSPLLLVAMVPIGALGASFHGIGLLVAGVVGLGAWLAAIIGMMRGMRANGRSGYRTAADVLVLAVLPVWGLLYVLILDGDCTTTTCDTELFRPFAFPEAWGLVAHHVVVSLAYAVSRRRPEALRPRSEVLVAATLASGIPLYLLIAVQLGPLLLAGLVFPPLFMPCLMPVLAPILLLVEIRSRLRRRGREAARRADPPQATYREGTRPLRDAPLSVHRGLLARALATSPLILGLHAVIQAAIFGRPSAALDALTKTCGHTLSTLPIVVLEADCHYLCTVAARGHGWLVKPERVGRRRGTPIVVNRQLAIANAFEDLLHERWPRFGRFARRVYDRLGLPVSRCIQSRWASDAVYLAMKPFEWGFAIFLLLFDRGRPEARIERMYRP